jgi:hypothetical protein
MQQYLPIRFVRLGILLVSLGALESGTGWLRYAELAGDTDAQSILQDQLVLDLDIFEPDWRICGMLTARSMIGTALASLRYPEP